MEERRFEGGSAAEAAIRACETLGVTRRDLQYKIVDKTGEGMDRRVTIAVALPAEGQRPTLEMPAPASTAGGGREAGGAEGRGPRPRGRGRGQAAGDRPRRDADGEPAAGVAWVGPATAEAPPPPPSPRSPAPRSLVGGRPGGARGRSRGEEAGEHRPRAGRQPGPALDLHPAGDEIAIQAPSRRPMRAAIRPASSRAERAVEIVAGIVQRMRLDLEVQLCQEDPEELWVELFGPDQQRIIGRHGETLLALQFVANRMLDRADEEPEPVNQILICDAGNYRGRRLEALEGLARTLGQRALADHRAVRLSPMSAHDRRVFHLALRDMHGVVTRSEGDGLLRSLLIIPSAASV